MFFVTVNQYSVFYVMVNQYSICFMSWNRRPEFFFIDNKEGLHDMLSIDSLTSGASLSGSAGGG